MGPAAGPDVRQELPAHLRGGARPRRAAARRGVQAAPRAPVRRRAAADRAARRAAGRRAAAPAAAAIPRAYVVVVPGRRAGRPADLLLGKSSDDDNGLDDRHQPASKPATPARRRPADEAPSRRAGRAHASPGCRSSPTAPVYVCLKAAGDRTLVDGETLAAGDARRTRYRSQRFTLTLGNGNVDDARQRQAARRARRRRTAIGYAIDRRRAGAALLAEPAADLRVSARAGHRRHRHRGADRPRRRPQRAVAGRAAARARRRPRAHRDRRRPAARTSRRRCASCRARAWT